MSDEYLPYSRPGTSQAAAESQRGTSANKREQVYAYIVASGGEGATVDEIAEATGIYRYTVAPRVTELERAGRIVDSKQTRPTPRRKQAIVWIVPLGQVALRL